VPAVGVLPSLGGSLRRHAATFGSLLMAAAFFGIGASTTQGWPAGGVPMVLLGAGGFGYGLATAALLAHLVRRSPPRRSPPTSAACTTRIRR